MFICDSNFILQRQFLDHELSCHQKRINDTLLKIHQCLKHFCMSFINNQNIIGPKLSHKQQISALKKHQLS